MGPVTVAQVVPLAGGALQIEAWADLAGSRPKLGVCAFPGPLAGEVRSYAEALSTLLGGSLGRLTEAEELNPSTADGLGAVDLVILGKESPSLIRRMLSPPVLQQAGPTAVLVVQEPRWPLKRILLILSGAAGDAAAVDWAVRLARPSSSGVTVLAIVPPVPAMYHGLSGMEQTLRSLLRTDTALGCEMREAGRRLAVSTVESTLRLRQGTAGQQICREMAEGDHDLAILATNPCWWWLRQLQGDPICSLLKWARWPVLFVEATTDQEAGTTSAPCNAVA